MSLNDVRLLLISQNQLQYETSMKQNSSCRTMVKHSRWGWRWQTRSKRRCAAQKASDSDCVPRQQMWRLDEGRDAGDMCWCPPAYIKGRLFLPSSMFKMYVGELCICRWQQTPGRYSDVIVLFPFNLPCLKVLLFISCLYDLSHVYLFHIKTYWCIAKKIVFFLFIQKFIDV